MSTNSLRILLFLLIQSTFSFTQKGFIPNLGFFQDKVKFYKDLPNGRLFVEEDGFTYNFIDYKKIKDLHHGDHHSDQFIKCHGLRMNFLGSNKLNKEIITEQKAAEYLNFFIGNNPEKWKTHVNLYGSLTRTEIYPGIDYRIYEKHDIKYDLIVHPYANPEDIKIQYEGALEVKIIEEKLYVLTSLGELIEDKPYAYQVIDGNQTEVMCNFKIIDRNLTFEFPEGYDPTIELVIDPTLIFSTYSGSTGLVSGDAATYDSQGNLYTSGGSFDANYPTTVGAFQQSYTGGGAGNWQIVISKFESNGSNLIYATYIGGTTSGGGSPFPTPTSDYPYSLFADSNDNLVILSQAETTDFPTTPGCFSNILNGTRDYVISKLSSDGANLIASTYLGGSDTDLGNFQEMSSSIFIDDQGAIYLAGGTNSTDFPGTSNAFQTNLAGDFDGVVAKLSDDLSTLFWATYIGGSQSDNAVDLKVASNGEIYVVGNTQSNDFIGTGGVLSTFSGVQDGFVAKISSDGGTLINRTFVGTSDSDKIKFVQLDDLDFVYVLGATSSQNYPISTGVYSSLGDQNYFIHKYTSDLSSTIFSTCIGGDGPGTNSSSTELYPTAFGVDYCQNIYFTGSVINSTGGFPLSQNAYSSNVKSLYICALENNASSLVYGSYFGGDVGTNSNGGSGSHYHETSNCRYDKNGVLYHTECTTSSNYPLENEYSGFLTQGNDGASFKFDFNFSIPLNEFDLGNDTTLNCGGWNLSVDGYENLNYLWSTGETSSSITIDTSGIYWVKAYHLCDTIYDTIEVSINIESQGADLIMEGSSCDNDLLFIARTADSNATFQWYQNGTVLLTEVDSILYLSQNNYPSGNYSCLITFSNGCTMSIEGEYDQSGQPPIAFFEYTTADTCGTDNLFIQNQSVANSGQIVSTFWDFGDGVNSSDYSPNHSYLISGDFEITLIVVNSAGCSDSITQVVSIEGCEPIELNIPNVFTPNTDGENDLFIIKSYGFQTLTCIILNRWGNEMIQFDALNGGWNGQYASKNASEGTYFYIITGMDLYGEQHYHKGFLTLLR